MMATRPRPWCNVQMGHWGDLLLSDVQKSKPNVQACSQPKAKVHRAVSTLQPVHTSGLDAASTENLFRKIDAHLSGTQGLVSRHACLVYDFANIARTALTRPDLDLCTPVNNGDELPVFSIGGLVDQDTPRLGLRRYHGFSSTARL
ncbi:hypothetical protein CH63R_04178 [Colletotrichum higginsianum IMI 349063]|uniref:Uncharacterized protein n=1 Tax=Colletotrichum higginsianum (strain IMI 349063) TaxID=759273 RepID=A0A1B7YIU7_COLHI|nr:hypothetical protein CH63R_04178 [Colletotrichum higginsianum IMI 349063]OBR11882.1 hypothetical protein CH63R_04178 [Colletotrichum higginsianum IMI 349063]